MTRAPSPLSSAEPGTALHARTFTIRRADLVRYAGASGDFNPIHWSDRVATAVGLPGVIAHGMYTMALASRAVGEWAGGFDRIIEYGVRFTRPVVVPDDDTGVDIEVSGTVEGVRDDGALTVGLTCTCRGEKVLGMARAVVRREA
ncbi:MAG: dehydratase [Propionibacteriales bacterium]|nr:dehydratase [Propionibacteriales bacterium]